MARGTKASSNIIDPPVWEENAQAKVVRIPHDSDAESGALACILSASKGDGERMLAELVETDFYEQRNVTVYRNLLQLQLDSRPLNIVELHQRLKARFELDDAGGSEYVMTLPDKSPSPENFPTFKATVKDFAVRREMIAQAEAQIGHALDLLVPVDAKPRLSLPPLIDAARFVAMDLPEPAQLIADILHQGSKLVLGGGSKSFKTWTLLDLALSVAYGSPWLNFNTQAAPVCFVNFELQPWTIQERIKALAHAKGITFESGRLMILNLRGKAGHYNFILPQIRERVKSIKSKCALIILDPIYKLYAAGGKENDSGDMAQLLNAIESLAVDTESAIAYASHFSKGNQAGKESIDRISGSGVFARDPDTILTFTQHETQDCFTVEATLRAFKPVSPFVVRWELPLMRAEADLNPANLKRVKGRKPKHDTKKLLAAIASKDERNPISISQWAHRLGIARTSLNDYLTGMRRNGWIITIGEGSKAQQAITNKGKAYLNE